MNVFILGTGRCGTMTISRAFEHATNFTSAHESASPSLYLMDYPEDHIETDNRLAWMLGALQGNYPDALYIHLLRDREETANSWSRRNDYPGSSLRGFGAGILGFGEEFQKRRYEIGLRHWDIVNANINEFVWDKNYQRVWLHRLTETFPLLWKWIGAEGDLTAAVAETKIHHNEGIHGLVDEEPPNEGDILWASMKARNALHRPTDQEVAAFELLTKTAMEGAG